MILRYLLYLYPSDQYHYSLETEKQQNAGSVTGLP